MFVLDFQTTDFGVDLLEIEVARIKPVAEPVEHLLVLFMFGIGDSFQESFPYLRRLDMPCSDKIPLDDIGTSLGT